MLVAIAGSLFLGAGLIAFWVCQFVEPSTLTWLTWITGPLGLCSMLSTHFMGSSRRIQGLIPLMCSAVLLSSWATALAVGSPAWQAWWTFWFGTAYLILGLRAFGPVQFEVGSEFESKGESQKKTAQQVHHAQG